jgi:hypothetical protein
MSREPKLTIVEEVTWQHGETFAETWRELSMGSEAIMEAFHETGVAAWPDDPELHEVFMDIEDEITARVFDAIRYAAVEAFVRIATEVLERERGRERGR